MFKITAEEKEMIEKRREVLASDPLKFYVSPEGKKPKAFEELGKIKHEFSKKELKDCTISVLWKGTVIGYLDSEKVIDEIFGG